jgi:ABC-type bacteriocin/lantibiotic exporter with double-glycine peptidase domain
MNAQSSPAQHDRTDCLPACVEMVLTLLGQPVERGWLRQVMESSDLGTPGFKVLNLTPRLRCDIRCRHR